MEPEQQGERRVALHKAAQLPLLMVCYHVPPTSSPEHYALEVARPDSERRPQFAALPPPGGSRSTRPRRQRAAATSRSIPASSCSSCSRAAASIRRAPSRRSTRNSIARARRRHRRGAAEGQKPVARRASIASSRPSPGKANLLGQYEVYFGDHRKLLHRAQRNGKGDGRRYQSVAARVLRRERNRTVATLIPEKPGGGEMKTRALC